MRHARRASDPESLLKVGLLLEKDPDISLRYNALRILVLRADPSSTVHLRNALKDEDPTVREVAAEMLAEFERLARAKKEKQPPAH
jgi:HEAT repeat protein